MPTQIAIRCTGCGETLHMDSAFAGGVCRCRHCRTIQTVPPDAPAVSGEAGASSEASTEALPAGKRALYRRDPSGGLEDLADAVASSGGAVSSGLRRQVNRMPARVTGPEAAGTPHAPAATGPDRKLAVAVASSAVLAVIAGALAVVVLTGNGSPAQAPRGGDRASASSASFAGLPLGHRTVFVVDRGTESDRTFPEVLSAVAAAVGQLPPTAEFQVVLWAYGVDGSIVALPGPLPRPASRENARLLVERGADVERDGPTTAAPAVSRALAGGPDTLILVTGKAWQLGDSFADEVLGELRVLSTDQRPVVHTVAVGDPSDGPGRPLARIARETGGQFTGLTPARLTTLVAGG